MRRRAALGARQTPALPRGEQPLREDAPRRLRGCRWAAGSAAHRCAGPILTNCSLRKPTSTPSASPGTAAWSRPRQQNHLRALQMTAPFTCTGACFTFRCHSLTKVASAARTGLIDLPHKRRSGMGGVSGLGWTIQRRSVVRARWGAEGRAPRTFHVRSANSTAGGAHATAAANLRAIPATLRVSGRTTGCTG